MRAKITRNLILAVFAFLSLVSPSSARAGEAGNMLEALKNLTCETKGVGDLLSSEFSHTCLPSTLMTHVIANIISPGTFPNILLRVKLNDDKLLPDKCKRENRANLTDLKLDFYLCSNAKLYEESAKGVANATIAIFGGVINCMGGDCRDPWDEVKESFDIPKSSYHEPFLGTKVGEQGNMYDIGLIPVIPWKVIRIGDKLCVATVSFAGWIPVGCKYIKEPYPNSIYADFFSLANPPADSPDAVALTTCSGMQSCYAGTHNNSRNGIIISAMVVECIKTMVAKLLISKNVCHLEDVASELNSSYQSTSVLYKFQMNMRATVSALLTLYVVFFGFRIILAGDILPKSEMFNFLFKIIFVMYFTIGITLTSNGQRFDGMTELVVPFILGGMTELTSWIITASENGLCYFNPNDYNDGYRFLSTWDSLDCRISHYLGLDMSQAMAANKSAKIDTNGGIDGLSFPIPAYLYLLVPALYSGNFFFVKLALLYPILVLSLGAFIVGSTTVCIIAVAILSILSPIFVPMILFGYTRQYFDGWVRLLIASMIQPMVAVAFLMTMMSVYDMGYYGKCKFNNAILDDDGRPVVAYYLDQDWSHYNDEEREHCQDSLGYMLTNPFGYLLDIGADIHDATNYPKISDPNDVPDAVESKPKLLMTVITTIFEKLKTMLVAMLNASFVIYLMYHFSKTLTGFVVDMTQGVSTGGMTISPTKVFDTAKAGLDKMKFNRSEGGGYSSDGAQDKASSEDKTPEGDDSKGDDDSKDGDSSDGDAKDGAATK